MFRPVLVAATALVIALGLVAPAAADQNSTADLASATLAGLRTGMTSDQVLAIIKGHFPHIIIARTPCMSDYLAALASGKPSASTRCIYSIKASKSANPDSQDPTQLNLLFVEDYPTHIGTMLLGSIEYRTKASTESIVASFASNIRVTYGQPSKINPTNAAILSYCNGLTQYINCAEPFTWQAAVQDDPTIDPANPPSRMACRDQNHNDRDLKIPSPSVVLTTEAFAGQYAQTKIIDYATICPRSAAMLLEIDKVK